jgi:hypothetical protein
VVIRISFLDFKRLKAGEKMSSSHNKSPQAIASKKPVFTVEASQYRSSVTAENNPKGRVEWEERAIPSIARQLTLK